MRYVDDFLLFDDSKERLAEMRHAIEDVLCGLRLRIHPRKSRVYRSSEGITFLGWRIFPAHSRLVRGNVVRFCHRMRGMQHDYARGRIGWEDIQPRVRAWNAHAEHGDTWKLRGKIFGQFAFRRRCMVK